MSMVAASPEVPPPAASAVPSVRRLIRGPLAFGLLVIVLFFGGFGAWASLAPLSSGAVAPGSVNPSSNRRVVQHLEGGIVSEVHVKEGDHVSEGQLLMTLESTRAEANFSSGRAQWLRLLVMRARLDAHTAGLDEMPVPAPVVAENSADLDAFVASQRALFESRSTTLKQQQDIFERQRAQLGSEISAIVAENAGLTTQLELIQSEYDDKAALLEEQLISRSQVQSLQRELARLQSVIASNQARIARAEQSIEENKLRILQVGEAFRDQVAQESTEVNNEIAQIDESMISSGDVLRRTAIYSPSEGTVFNLNYTTPGGVVGPGSPVMEIVPTNDDLLIIVRLAPKDFDVVTEGLIAHVTLVPFANRNALPLNGEVVQVAADITRDERSGIEYYDVRVRVPSEELAKHEGMYMAPGMPADVTIVTGERTMVQYLAEPLLRSLRNAFVAK